MWCLQRALRWSGRAGAFGHARTLNPPSSATVRLSAWLASWWLCSPLHSPVVWKPPTCGTTNETTTLHPLHRCLNAQVGMRKQEFIDEYDGGDYDDGDNERW